MPKRLAASAAIAAAGLLMLAGGACAPDRGADGTGGGTQVVTAFYPLQFVTERVGGDQVSVTSLTPPGVVAHDLEVSPSQVLAIVEADLVVHLAGFQPAVDDAVAAHAGRALDVATTVTLLDPGGEHDDPPDDPPDDPHEGHADGDGGQDHGSGDPHVWLDPTRLASIADAVATELAAVDPEHAERYAARADGLQEELAALDREYADGLAECARREIVVSHAAFGYLADRYDLRQVAISGLSPEQEPTPQRLAEVAREAQRHGATTIFFEVLVDPRVAAVIAEQVGAETATLDPIEGLTPDGDHDYFSLMRQNLTTLRTALECP